MLFLVRKQGLTAIAGLLLVLVTSMPAFASPARRGSADHGEHCHDGALPTLTCFSSELERDIDFDEWAESALGMASSSGYVIAYEHASFGGSSVLLSQDYGNLGFIGWSDTISSYRVYVSATGSFHVGTWYTGGVQTFCCFTNVSYVGDAMNDAFSSLNLP